MRFVIERILLGSVHGRNVVRLLGELAREQQRAVIVVTHDPRGDKLANRMVPIENERIA